MDEGLTYEKIQKIRWQTLEGDSFALADFDDSTQGIAKYPHANRYEPELLFWTLRDMNALKRSRTFILDRMANAVDVNPLQLARYCYIDCFKAYAHVPYYLGNLNIPYNKALFPQIEKDVIALSKARHPEIFGPSPTPCPQVIARVKKYINLSLFANRYKTDEQFGK